MKSRDIICITNFFLILCFLVEVFVHWKNSDISPIVNFLLVILFTGDAATCCRISWPIWVLLSILSSS